MLVSDHIAESASVRPSEPPRPPRRPAAWLRSRKFLVVVGAGIVAGLLLLIAVIRAFRMPPAESSARSIAVVKVDREKLQETLTLAAEFHPYQQVSLHAKVAGYVQWISVDVGDRVKEGQVLAGLDIPELKNDLERDTAAVQASREEVNRAQASYDQTHLAWTRLETVAKDHPKLVAQQEVDDARAKDQNASGALAAARQHVDESTAQLHKTQALLAYGDITAPFDAIVTHRYVDPGALIQAGTSSSQTTPVVDIEQESRLRLVFPVPESAVARIKVGQKVRVSVNAVHETFDAVISRFADKVDRETRTMRTEADVENPDGRFKPGMYADATIVVQERDDVVSAPVEAVSMAGKPTVLKVDQKGIVHATPVRLGLATPSRFEVVSGLSPGDLVVVGSRTAIRDGDKVKPKIMTPAATDEK